MSKDSKHNKIINELGRRGNMGMQALPNTFVVTIYFLNNKNYERTHIVYSFSSMHSNISELLNYYKNIIGTLIYHNSKNQSELFLNYDKIYDKVNLLSLGEEEKETLLDGIKNLLHLTFKQVDSDEDVFPINSVSVEYSNEDGVLYPIILEESKIFESLENVLTKEIVD